jgi:hypothetical protein
VATRGSQAQNDSQHGHKPLSSAIADSRSAPERTS